jgi:hypothetical protein
MIEGVPKEWAKNLNLQIDIDHHKLMSTSNLPDEIRPEKDLPSAIVDLINSQPILLSDILTYE